MYLFIHLFILFFIFFIIIIIIFFFFLGGGGVPLGTQVKSTKDPIAF